MFISLISAFVISIILSGIQYLYKSKSWLFFVLRALTYFFIILLLFNPKIQQKSRVVTKPKLYVLADQSQSIKFQNATQTLKLILDSISNSKLSDKFEIHRFGFTDKLFALDTLNFSGKRTDIAQAINGIKDLTDKSTSPLILLTDGNSNKGNDYVYAIGNNDKLNIYPVVLGDTTQYANLSVDEINTNPIALKGNRFPVEIFVSYKGNKPQNSTLFIYDKTQKVFQKKLSFKSNDAKVIQAKLPAKYVGQHHYRVYLSHFDNEKNTKDNSKYFSIEIIDQSHKIAIISDIIHPDIGAIKRSLSTNKYLKVKLFRPEDKIDLKKYATIILYQPDSKFSSVLKNTPLNNVNWLIITGLHTDWNWLNQQKIFFKRDFSKTKENYFPVKNNDFSLFEIPALNYEKLPPLVDKYGKISFSQGKTVLFTSIKGIKTKQPLVLVNSNPKQAVIFGENIWQWKIYSGIQGKKNEFNRFISSLVQYVLLRKDYNKIKLDYKNVYSQSEPVVIRASILNENLERNLKAQPMIKLYKDKKLMTKVPMILENDAYKIDFADLEPGNYSFEISDTSLKKQKRGGFSITDVNIESLQNTANVNQLKLLAKNTNAKLFYTNQIHNLINELSKQNTYPSHSKIITKKSPLIDYKWLLFLITLLLALEWFIKKLQGKL